MASLRQRSYFLSHTQKLKKKSRVWKGPGETSDAPESTLVWWVCVLTLWQEPFLSGMCFFFFFLLTFA